MKEDQALTEAFRLSLRSAMLPSLSTAGDFSTNQVHYIESKALQQQLRTMALHDKAGWGFIPFFLQTKKLRKTEMDANVHFLKTIFLLARQKLPKEHSRTRKRRTTATKISTLARAPFRGISRYSSFRCWATHPKPPYLLTSTIKPKHSLIWYSLSLLLSKGVGDIIFCIHSRCWLSSLRPRIGKVDLRAITIPSTGI